MGTTCLTRWTTTQLVGMLRNSWFVDVRQFWSNVLHLHVSDTEKLLTGFERQICLELLHNCTHLTGGRRSWDCEKVTLGVWVCPCISFPLEPQVQAEKTSKPNVRRTLSEFRLRLGLRIELKWLKWLVNQKMGMIDGNNLQVYKMEFL